ncbi:reverse transcriptase domain-containing protein [Tanacetum coccineum]|uniref:Reverse transcriptase domain-containing protein n=1 Tax=Tanacetum coccineum TaxID=301880 RepID=A0ABQ5F0J4_9ASTR
MSTRSSSSDLFPSSSDPESIIQNRRRNLCDPSLLFDFEEINMNPNNVQGPPPADQDSLNSAAGGNLLTRNTQEALTIIENKSKVRTSRNKPQVSSASGSSSQNDVITALIKQVEALISSMTKPIHSIQEGCDTCGGQHSYYECQATGGYNQDVYATTGTYNAGGNSYQSQGMLPRNTIPNPQEDIKVITTRSGITLVGPSVPPPSSSSSKEVKRDPETITDQVHISSIESTVRVSPPVVHPSPASTSFVIPERNPHQPPIPYRSRLNKEKLQDKSDIQIHKFLQMFKKLHFNISFPKALAYMPKYAKMLKNLITNKEKLLELENTPLNENCSAVLLKKLPEKLKDPGKFLIPCDFDELEECMALADLGANINLMPLCVWKKLMLPELVPTRMTLELANRSVSYPAGIAEDVFVQVGKFTFPADFVVVDYDIDPRVPLILGRAFLRMARALVDIHGEELTLRVRDEKLVFNVESTSKYPQKHGDESIHMIDILDTTFESLSPFLTPFGDSDFLLEETDAFLFIDDSIPLGIDNGIYDSEGDILFLEELLNGDPTPNLPPSLTVFEINETKKIKSSIEDPPDLELKDLPPHLEYAFLEGTSKLPVIIAKDLKREEKEQLLTIPIDPQDQEKTTFTCTYGTFSYRRMPFSLCNAPGTFQRCMEKCHFMDKEGIVLGYKISKSGIEVDRAKVDVIAKLPPPTTVKGIRSFLDFDIEIRDKKGAENLAADHLSILENHHLGDLVGMEMNEKFPHESLNMISLNPDDEPP